MYKTDLLKKDELGKLFMVSYNPTSWTVQGIVYNIKNGKAYNLTDLPEGQYENFKICENSKKNKLDYFVKDCTTQKLQYTNYICNILGTTNIKGNSYYLINTLCGNIIWVDKDELKTYLSILKNTFETNIGNFKFESDDIVVTRYKNQLSIDEFGISLNGASKLYNKLITCIVNSKIRQHLLGNLKQVEITNDESHFNSCIALNTGNNIETVKDTCRLAVKIDDRVQEVGFYTEFLFDTKINLRLKVFMLGLGKFDINYVPKWHNYSYEIGKKIKNPKELREVLEYISSSELYEQIEKDVELATKQEIISYKVCEQKNNYMIQAKNERLAKNNLENKNITYELVKIVKYGSKVHGYVVRNINTNMSGYIDRAKVIELAQKKYIKNVEVYKHNEKLNLRGKNGFTINSLPKLNYNEVV